MPTRTLVIADGTVTGLLACAGADRGRRAGTDSVEHVVWGPVSGPRARAGSRQAELLGLAPVSPSDETAANTGPHELEAGEVAVLIAAACLARGRGITTVVWPANAGP